MKMFYKSLSFRMFYNYFEYFKESLSSCTQLKCLLRHCRLVFVPLGFSVTIDICLPGQYLYRHSHPVQCTVYSICIVTVTLYVQYLYRHCHPVQCTVFVSSYTVTICTGCAIVSFYNFLGPFCPCIECIHYIASL